MDDLIDTFANRLSYALTVRNMKPIELAEITQINKSKISSYMAGRYKAKTDGLKLIADALNVSPVWLMGYDVPMKREETKNTTISQFDDNTLKHIENYNKLNVLGKQTADIYVEGLTEISKYTEKKTELSDA